MKNIVLIILLFLLNVSCGKLPINGKLDGMWELMEIEDLSTGEIEYPDMRTFYSIQLHLIRLHQIHEGSVDDSRMSVYIGDFEHQDNSLYIYNFRIYIQEDQLATLEQLARYGMHATEVEFQIKELTSKKMILESDYARLYFRKF